ncbi:MULTISPECIES: PEP-utilizing enzyme, TIM barrel domain protein [Paenibacillus]|uniref:PEP-utilizing enzyme, TIM barrel domain protein n=1 Tax=Paenibacillus campinasensis TaxID=66347 RepID=A0ABW9T727_9BACL|nr:MULTISPECIES: PEP-utilizing enzyme, TIM barrel domain protein [Paenibacillus]MUG66996.1 PEP-utilizing enzyme, TIM barrel domain protein [Paenibacillus campinasensis]PAK50812.1 hypothetical protein CHH75_16405 [Paenibacillus sp. 7541]
MTERQWDSSRELGERLYEVGERAGNRARAGASPETDVLNSFRAAGGITHEEVLLMLAAPEDIEEALRVTGAVHAGEVSPSLTRLLGWSDLNRHLKVLSCAACAEQIREDLRLGAQGVGLVRGEAALETAGVLREVFSAWLTAREESRAEFYRRRFIWLWTAYWVSVLQAAGDAPCAISLVQECYMTGFRGKGRDVLDAQLESIFRAVEQCWQAGIDCQPELLIMEPDDAEVFRSVQDFVEEVARQTLGEAGRSVRFRMGVLFGEGSDPEAAADVARIADMIVLDLEAQRFSYWSEEERKELQASFAAAISRIRTIKPELPIRVNGVDASDLRYAYKLGAQEVSCASRHLAAVRLTGARLELRRRSLPWTE